MAEARAAVTLVVGDNTYRLAESFDGVCEMEERTHKSTGEVMLLAAGGSMIATRALIFAYLQKYHADDFKTLDAVSAVIDVIGMAGITEQLAALTTGPEQAPRRQRRSRKRR